MGTASRANLSSHDFRGIRPTGIKDMLGHDLDVGDVVLADILIKQIRESGYLRWRIQEVTPIVDPRAEAGGAVLQLSCIVAIPVKLGVALPLARIATAAEVEAEMDAQKRIVEP